MPLIILSFILLRKYLYKIKPFSDCTNNAAYLALMYTICAGVAGGMASRRRSQVVGKHEGRGVRKQLVNLSTKLVQTRACGEGKLTCHKTYVMDLFTMHSKVPKRIRV